MKRFFQFIWTQIKRVPWYGYLSGVILFLINLGAYEIGKRIIYVWSESWRVTPAIPGIDTNIPFVPYFFSQMYFLWYPIVIFTPMVLSVIVPKEHYINVVLAQAFGQVIAFFIFICAPSYMDRTNVAGVVTGGFGNLIERVQNGSGFSYWLMKIVMKADGGVDNYNLFPSLHCYMITFCYLGVMNRKETHVAYRSSLLVVAILICLSTIFTKQHYLVDLLIGVLLAIVCYLIFVITNPAKRILKKWPNFLIIKKLNWANEKIIKKGK